MPVSGRCQGIASSSSKWGLLYKLYFVVWSLPKKSVSVSRESGDGNRLAKVSILSCNDFSYSSLLRRQIDVSLKVLKGRQLFT